jgi:hypothetical protein
MPIVVEYWYLDNEGTAGVPASFPPKAASGEKRCSSSSERMVSKDSFPMSRKLSTILEAVGRVPKDVIESSALEYAVAAEDVQVVEIV